MSANEQVDPQAGKPEPRMPEYADIIQPMIDTAQKVEDQVQGQINSRRARDAETGIKPHRYDTWGPSERELASKYVKAEDKATVRRVGQMLADATMEQNARETVATGGKNKVPDYVPGSRSHATNVLSTGGEKWDLQNVTTYRVEDGKAVKVNQLPGSPQRMEKVESKHKFSPENQARAQELIKRLSEKQGAREVERRRRAEVSMSQREVDKLNTPKASPEDIQKAS